MEAGGVGILSDIENKEVIDFSSRTLVPDSPTRPWSDCKYYNYSGKMLQYLQELHI